MQGPLTIDRARADHLEMLARYAQQQSVELARLLKERLTASSDQTCQHGLLLAEELVSLMQARSRHTWDGHFTWAAGDGRQLRQHHLVGLRRYLSSSTAVSSEAGSHEDLGSSLRKTLARGRLPVMWLVSPRQADVFLSSAPEHMSQMRTTNEASCIPRAAELVKQLCGDILQQLAQGKSLQDPAGDAPRLLLVGAAAAAVLLDALDTRPPTGLTVADARLRAALLLAVAIKTLDTLLYATADLGPLASGFRQEAQSLLAAGPDPSAAFRRYARRLIDGWQKARTLLRVEGDFATLLQRQALLLEWEEIQRGEMRLGQLAESWEARPDATQDEAPFDTEIAEAIAQQEARLAACKLLLLDTQHRLETRSDAAVEMALLRVVLDEAAADLDVLGALVQRRLEPAARFRQRPLVEPGFEAPPANLAAYLAMPENYQSGDFLLAAVDLVRPRLTPEMLGKEPWPTVAPDVARLWNMVDPLRGLWLACQAAMPRRHRSRVEQQRSQALAWRANRLEEDLFISAAVACVTAGPALHPQAARTALETACARFVLGRLVRHADRLSGSPAIAAAVPSTGGMGFALERMVVLGQLQALLTGRCPAGAPNLVPRHLSPEALELEAVKAEVHRPLQATLEFLRGMNGADCGLSLLGFALASTAAWMWAADCTLGRLAWIGRTRLDQMPDEPTPLPPVGRRAFERCLMEVRTRVQRLEEDLAALRRGYPPPQARAAVLLFTSAAL
jgi:hypothetical protein